MPSTSCRTEFNLKNGNLNSCSEDSDCDPGVGSVSGFSCDLTTCSCSCESNYCLGTSGGVCSFNCDCLGACDGAGNCGNVCPSCTNSTDCSPDEDCIEGECISSGLCTSNKESVCDAAYSVITGSTDNSAKCCPATSMCVKGGWGAPVTSVCSTECGTTCFDASSNPQGEDGYSPESFCSYGSRVERMPSCTEIAVLSIGELSCDLGDGVGDNSICCAAESGGDFTCSLPDFGPASGSPYFGPACVSGDRTSQNSMSIPAC